MVLYCKFKGQLTPEDFCSWVRVVDADEMTLIKVSQKSFRGVNIVCKMNIELAYENFLQLHKPGG